MDTVIKVLDKLKKDLSALPPEPVYPQAVIDAAKRYGIEIQQDKNRVLAWLAPHKVLVK